MQKAAILRHALPANPRLQHHPQVFRICLQLGEVFSLAGDHRGAQIVSADSVLWVTQNGDVEDYVLQPGEHFGVSRPGRIVVEGMRRF